MTTSRELMSQGTCKGTIQMIRTAGQFSASLFLLISQILSFS